MAKRFIVLLALLLYTTQTYSTVPVDDPCKNGYNCQSCVLIKLTPWGEGVDSTCQWEVTSSRQMCVASYTPSQATNVAFNQIGCITIAMPSTTITPPTTPISTCSEQTSCEACVDPDLQSKDRNGKCVWEVTSVGQNCFSQDYYFPSQKNYKIAFSQEGCSTLSSTTTTKSPPPERDPCLAENTCESCVRTATSSLGLENLSTCLWVATPSNGHCASTFTPSQEIDKIAFTLNGCATSPPPPTCEQQDTCEACLSTILQGDTNTNGTCVWEVKTTGQRCAPVYTRSQEITNVVFSQSSCPAIQPTIAITRTTLVIPELKCECRDSSFTYVRPADADDYINEIDVDDHDQSSARGPMRPKHRRRYGQRRDHEDFVKNIHARKFNRMQKRQRKLAEEGGSKNPRLLRENEDFMNNQMIISPSESSDPCLVGINCESCVRTPNGVNGHDSCVWEITSGGSLCVANYTPSQEILNVFFHEEQCKKLEN